MNENLVMRASLEKCEAAIKFIFKIVCSGDFFILEPNPPTTKACLLFPSASLYCTPQLSIRRTQSAV